MRELKFRTWDSQTMSYDVTLWINPIHKTAIVWDCMRDCKIEGLTIMQYTGLKDKNGKEIYEGDIVQRGIIVFKDGKFQGNYYESGGGLAETWEDDLCQEKGIEVLGNIYQHKHLLE